MKWGEGQVSPPTYGCIHCEGPVSQCVSLHGVLLMSPKMTLRGSRIPVSRGAWVWYPAVNANTHCAGLVSQCVTVRGSSFPPLI